MFNVADICKNLIMQRFNVPQNVTNPQDIVQYLLNTGQVSQDQLNRAIQMRDNPNVLNDIFGLKR